jgi:hypothetical protein
VTGALARVFGVDPRTFGVLHRAFWTLSRRASSGLVQGREPGKEKPVSAGLWVYAVFGAFAAIVGVVATHGGPREAYGAIALGMTLVLVGLAVVADFAAVVVAPGDDEILFHLPLSSRTYLAARLSVAARHTALLSLAYAAAPALVGAVAWRNALYAPVLLAAAVWTGLFALLLSFLAYRVALRLLGGERMRTLLAYVPGVFSLAMAFLPQFLPARVDRAGEAVSGTLDAYGWALPPAWFSATAEAALGAFDGGTLLRAALGLAVVPLGALVLVVALGRGFLDDLQRLVSAKDAGPSRAPAAPRPLPPGRLARAVFRLRGAEERAGWLLYAGAMRSRASRARMFPMLVIPFVFVAMGLVREGGAAPMSAMGLYLAASAAGSLVAFLPYHEHKDGAWLLEAAPPGRYGRLYLGILSAMLARHALPPVLALAAIVSVLDPTPATIGGSLHAATGALLSTALVASMSRPEVPFSRGFQVGEQGSKTSIMFVNFALLGVLGGVHALVAVVFPWAFLATVPLVVWLSVLWLRSVADRLDAHPPQELRPARSWAGAM